MRLQVKPTQISKEMNKTELIAAVAEKTGLTKVEAKNAVEAVMGTTVEALQKGDKLSLVGFGTFSVSERGERKARNIKTGAEIIVPAKKVVKFKAGADLKL